MDPTTCIKFRRTQDLKKLLKSDVADEYIKEIIDSRNLLLTSSKSFLPRHVHEDILRSRSYVLILKFTELHCNDSEVMIKMLHTAITMKYTTAIKQIIDKLPRCEARLALLNHTLKTAYKEKYYLVVTMLLDAGANIHIENNFIPKDLVRHRQYSRMRDYLKYMDININDGELLQLAFNVHDKQMALLLLNNGLMDTFTETMHLSEYNRDVLNKWRKNHRMKRLVQATKTAMCKDVFKWQPYARVKSRDSTEKLLQCLVDLQKYIRLSDISFDDNVATTDDYSYRAICARLAKLSEPLISTDSTLEGYDLCGNLLSHLPKYKIIRIAGRVYNILDLIHIIRKGPYDGHCVCPYTRKQLPKCLVVDEYARLKSILTCGALIEPNLLESVKNTPILSPMNELKYQLVDIFSKLSYVPSITAIVGATDNTINDMMYNLYLVTREQPQHYPSINQTSLNKIKSLTELPKKTYFVSLLSDILAIRDVHYTTRVELLSIVMRHYKEDGSTHFNDTLSWMLETLGDVDANILFNDPWYRYQFEFDPSY